MADTKSDAKQEKCFIDPATGAPSGSSSSGGITGSGTEAGNQTTSTKGNGTEKLDTSAFGEGRSKPGGNIGGRNPGTSSKTIGDQDSTQGRNDMDMVDPMTRRSPGQLDKLIQQDHSREIAERDP